MKCNIKRTYEICICLRSSIYFADELRIIYNCDTAFAYSTCYSLICNSKCIACYLILVCTCRNITANIVNRYFTAAAFAYDNSAAVLACYNRAIIACSVKVFFSCHSVVEVVNCCYFGACEVHAALVAYSYAFLSLCKGT